MPYLLNLGDMADIGDESNDRNDHDGNATRSTSDTLDCTQHIAFVYLPAMIKLYLTKIQHYVSIGYDNILDPIYCDYQYFFLHRTYLAALHFNENVTMPQSRTNEGEKQCCALY